MSSPIHQAKDLDPVLEYAPQWARDRAQAPTDDVAAPPIEWPPPGRRLDNVCILGDDRAALEARRELALQPEKVPEPPQPDASDQIVGKTVLAVCGVAGVAAVVAWTLVSTLDGGSLKHEAAQASSQAKPIAVNSKQNDAPAAPATTCAIAA
jgi:hypothetical protein